MKLVRLLLVAAAVCIPFAASAQTSVTFTNNDGTFTYTNSTGVLELDSTPSGGNAGVLTAISGLSAFGINDAAVAFNPITGTCTPACLGTITLQTGAALPGGSITSTDPLQAVHFAAGGNFTVSYAGLGVTFAGTFTSASWTSAGIGSNTWNFFGTIMNGTLTIGSNTYTIPTAVTVQLTTVGAAPVFHPNKGTYTFKDNQGSTNFAITPEPGTLALFGSGLIVVGLLTRRRLGART